MPLSIQGFRHGHNALIGAGSVNPASDNALLFDIQTDGADAVDVVLKREDGAAQFGAEREADRVHDQCGIHAHGCVVDGVVDAVEGGASEALVAIVQVLADSTRGAFVDGAEFHLAAVFAFESRWTDAPETKRILNSIPPNFN